VLKENDQFIF